MSGRPSRGASPGRWLVTPNRALAVLFLGAGGRCVGIVIEHGVSTSDLLVLAVLGGACVAIGIALLFRDTSAHGPVRSALVATLIAVTTVLVAVASNRAEVVLRAFGYPWAALYAAAFMSHRAARVYAVVSSAAFAGGIVVTGIPDMLDAWLLVTVTVLAVTAVTSSLVTALRLQSETDPLTGAANRAGFFRLATQVMTAAARQQQTVAVVVCDFDGFKHVNDRHGHAAGDALLRDVAEAWVTTLRADDVFARYGGDEFAIILPNADSIAAEETVARLRHATTTAFSAGIAVASPGDALDTIIACADAAMYADKEARSRQDALPAQRASEWVPTSAILRVTHGQV